MKNKYFFAKFWQLTMVLTILTQFLVIFISKTRGLLLNFFFANYQLPVFFCTSNFQTPCMYVCIIIKYLIMFNKS
jgi:hypothetical protein